jgi:protein required for attachment to host cells
MQATYPIWILISDSSRARVYSVDTAHRPMILREAFEHTESRAMEHELVTDRPGRMPQSHGGPHAGHPGHGSHSGMEPHTSAKTLEHQRFAHTLAESLNAHYHRNEYARLILTANPEFLGLLRDNLDDQVRKNVVSLNKNYTNLDTRELEHQLSSLLAE